MPDWSTRIRRCTHSRRFLWRAVFAILLSAFAIACVLRWAAPAASSDAADGHGSPDIGAGRGGPVVDGDIDFDLLLELLARAGPLSDADTTALLGSVVQDASRRAIVEALLASLDQTEPATRLIELAGEEPAVRYANTALGHFYASHGRFAEAAVAFEREGRAPEAHRARRAAIDCHMRARDDDALDRLAREPRYAPLFDAETRMAMAIARRQWWTVLKLIVPTQVRDIEATYLVLAGLSGLLWFLFLLAASQARRLLSLRTGLCLAGVGLGALSTVPTVLALIWQEEVLGLAQQTDLRGGLIYYVAGVGLREEVIKLLFFAPLAPLLARRRDPLEILIVAGCVGLGFAAEENAQYFAGSLAVSAPGRFLTANFFHIALTGLAGLALCNLIRSPSTAAGDFAVVLGVVILVHGMYDALLSLPALADYSLFAMTAFVLMGYQFFGHLRAAQVPRRATVSLTSILALGFALLAGLAFIHAGRRVGISDAASLLVPDILGVVLIIIMYVREVPETLGP